MDDRRIHNGAFAHKQSPLRKQAVDFAEQRLGELVRFEQPPKGLRRTPRDEGLQPLRETGASGGIGWRCAGIGTSSERFDTEHVPATAKGTIA